MCVHGLIKNGFAIVLLQRGLFYFHTDVHKWFQYLLVVRGLDNFWPRDGRLREYGTDKGGWGQKSQKLDWRHLWTAPILWCFCNMYKHWNLCGRYWLTRQALLTEKIVCQLECFSHYFDPPVSLSENQFFTRPVDALYTLNIVFNTKCERGLVTGPCLNSVLKVDKY